MPEETRTPAPPQTASASPEAKGRVNQMHYIITVQYTAANGLNVSTMSGVMAVNGRTREQLYADIYGKVTSHHGAPPARTSVLFFDLAPDKIDTVA
ncbi:hypothetical protein [Nocardia niigatensis]